MRRGLACAICFVDTRLDEPLILAVPNNGAEKARYGLLYTAPQRYGRVVVSRPRLQLRMPHRPVVWMNLQIDELGVVRRYTLTDQAKPEQGWVDTIDEFCKTADVPAGIPRRQAGADAVHGTGAGEIAPTLRPALELEQNL